MQTNVKSDRYSQHSASQVPAVHMARSKFDRSHSMKTTFFFDDLTPIFVDEVLPGDTFNLNTHVFARLATQLVPIMDNMYIDFFYFFVPNRLTWNNFEKFLGAQDNPGDTTDYIFPSMTAPSTGGGYATNSIFDQFGLLPGVNSLKINMCLPFRAYNRIYNEWFRDQNLQDSVPLNLDDGPDSPSDYTLLPRGKRHDYFTACLPFPQKGPAVDLPLGGLAPVIPDVSNPVPTWQNSAGSYVSGIGSVTGSTTTVQWTTSAPTGAFPAQWDHTGLVTDLSSASAATINQLRQAFAMQSFFELDARGGTRYVEKILAHFNVVSPDARLQRTEYLGGGQIKINSHPVAQTAPTVSGSPQANLAAFGTASTQGSTAIGFTKSFVEHGYVIGMCAARADLTYQQGTNRMWLKSTEYDLMWPKFQEIGEQAVQMGEIYTTGTSADLNVFGYIPRYDEYRYKQSEIRGEFRSTYVDSLDVWHMAQDFTTPPALNSAFISSNTPIARALAVTDDVHLIMDVFFQYHCARPMTVNAIPSNLGRF